MPTSDPCPVQRDPEVDERNARENEQHNEEMNDYDGVGEHGILLSWRRISKYPERSEPSIVIENALVVAEILHLVRVHRNIDFAKP